MINGCEELRECLGTLGWREIVNEEVDEEEEKLTLDEEGTLGGFFNEVGDEWSDD